MYITSDDGQKQPKHVVDDSWLYNVLKIVLALTIVTDIIHIQKFYMI